MKRYILIGLGIMFSFMLLSVNVWAESVTGLPAEIDARITGDSILQNQIDTCNCQDYDAIIQDLTNRLAALECIDRDGDGYFAGFTCLGDVDCDDTDYTIHPGATDVCGDGIDQDCSGTDEVCGDVNRYELISSICWTDTYNNDTYCFVYMDVETKYDDYYEQDMYVEMKIYYTHNNTAAAGPIVVGMWGALEWGTGSVMDYDLENGRICMTAELYQPEARCVFSVSYVPYNSTEPIFNILESNFTLMTE
jgi:putative metal-binding protein